MKSMRSEIMWAVANVKTGKRVGKLKDTRKEARDRARSIIFPTVRVVRVRVTEAP